MAAEAESTGGSLLIVFPLFTLSLFFLYALPLLATIYSTSSHKRWAAYWLVLLPLNYFVHPFLTWIIGANAGTFLHFVLGLVVLYLVSNEKVSLNQHRLTPCAGWPRWAWESPTTSGAW